VATRSVSRCEYPSATVPRTLRFASSVLVTLRTQGPPARGLDDSRLACAVAPNHSLRWSVLRSPSRSRSLRSAWSSVPAGLPGVTPRGRCQHDSSTAPTFEHRWQSEHAVAVGSVHPGSGYTRHCSAVPAKLEAGPRRHRSVGFQGVLGPHVPSSRRRGSLLRPSSCAGDCRRCDVLRLDRPDPTRPFWDGERWPAWR
jgi:hypothetical protein